VKGGDLVWVPDTVVARHELPGQVHSKNVAADLGPPSVGHQGRAPEAEGAAVKKGETVADTIVFGVFKSTSLAPIRRNARERLRGHGQAIYREAPIPGGRCNAYVPRKVVEVIPNDGNRRRGAGSAIQGSSGIGGRNARRGEDGRLIARRDPRPLSIKPEHAGKILVGGKIGSLATIQAAAKAGRARLVVGESTTTNLRKSSVTTSRRDHRLRGDRITVVVTEGFGEIGMRRRPSTCSRASRGRKPR